MHTPVGQRAGYSAGLGKNSVKVLLGVHGEEHCYCSAVSVLVVLTMWTKNHIAEIMAYPCSIRFYDHCCSFREISDVNLFDSYI